MRILARSAWGAAAPAAAPDPIRGQVGQVWVHHSGFPAGESPTVTWRSIQRYEQTRLGYNDIAYTFGILADGTIVEGRGWRVVGAHTTGQNRISYGICLLGNFELEVPTAEALEALADLIADGVRQGVLSADVRIGGHRDAPGNVTACPGTNLYVRLPEVRKAVAARLAGPTSPADRPTAPGPDFAALARAIDAAKKRVVRQGSRGEAVVWAQTFLRQKGFDPGPADGRFGPQTARAVRAFQAAHRIRPVDGVVGPITWKVLAA